MSKVLLSSSFMPCNLPLLTHLFSILGKCLSSIQISPVCLLSHGFSHRHNVITAQKEKRQGISLFDPVVKNLPSSAGNMGSVPDWGANQCPMWHGATKPMNSPYWAHTPQLGRNLHSATRTRHSQINKYLKRKRKDSMKWLACQSSLGIGGVGVLSIDKS